MHRVRPFVSLPPAPLDPNAIEREITRGKTGTQA
jgi:hypothetical protein